MKKIILILSLAICYLTSFSQSWSWTRDGWNYSDNNTKGYRNFYTENPYKSNTVYFEPKGGFSYGNYDITIGSADLFCHWYSKEGVITGRDNKQIGTASSILSAVDFVINYYVKKSSSNSSSGSSSSSSNSSSSNSSSSSSPYTNEVNFTLGTQFNSSKTYGSFKDVRDGKTYITIKIGTQTWLAENLAYKPSSGNFWAYDNNSSYVVKYGYLYDWETAKKVCPVGWHLPSVEEWTTLANYLGGEKIAGGKMKATIGWQYDENGNATNESGFTALPAAYRDAGTFQDLGWRTNFWTSTPRHSDTWIKALFDNYGNLLPNS